MPSTNIVAFTLLQKPVQDFVNNFLSEVYKLKLKINKPESEEDLIKILTDFNNLLNNYSRNEQIFLVSLLLPDHFLNTYFKNVDFFAEDMLGKQYFNDLCNYLY